LIGAGGAEDIINERQLRYFAKVVEVGNMTRAAAMLNVAQPALGLQIRQLEDLLGTELLERHSRGVSVTPAGQLLYEHAIKILAMFETAESQVRALVNSGRENVRLGITHSIMRLAGSELIVAARRDLPDVLLSLVEEPSTILVKELEAGDIDLALTYETAESGTLSFTPVQVEELLFVTRIDRAPEANALSLADALAHELVLAGPRDPIRRSVEAEANKAGLSVDVGYEVQSLLATRQVVLDGLAASILPYGVVSNEIEDGSLAYCRIADQALQRTLYIARPVRGAHFVNEAAIMKLLRAVVRQLALDLGPLARGVQPSV